MSLLDSLKAVNPFAVVTDAIGTVIDRLVPDRVAADKMKLEAAAILQTQEYQLLLQQLEINKIEAGTDLFRGGWRPALGWMCVSGFSYEYVLRPFLVWGSEIFKMPIPPSLNTEQLIALIVPMLGLAAYRTVEKLNDKG